MSMIRETRDLIEISKCFPMEKELRVKGYDATPLNDGIAMIVRNAHADPNFHFWLADNEEKEMTGYMFFNVIPGGRLFIGRVWTKRWDMEQVERFKKKLEEFSAGNGVTSWSAFANRHNTFAMMHGYGFEPVATLAERRL